MAKAWLDEEIQYLEKNSSTMTVPEIIDGLCCLNPSIRRTEMAVIHKIGRLNLPGCPRRPREGDWTSEDDQYVRDNHQKDRRELARALNRSPVAVGHRLKKLGYAKPRSEILWSPEEKQLVLDNPKMSIKELGKILPGRSVTSVRRKRIELGLEKLLQNESWDRGEIKKLQNNLQKPMSILLRLLPNRSEGSIRGKARKLGRKRTTRKGHSYIGGYKRIYEKGKEKSEHTQIIEKSIGRRLRKDEVIHHINHVKDDNRLENLDLMHKKTHATVDNSLRSLMDPLLKREHIRYNFRTHKYEAGKP